MKPFSPSKMGDGPDIPFFARIAAKTPLRVALENLLGNAWKYTRRSERPSIEFGRSGDEVPRPFFIRDNGIGFDMAYADRLFSPFQRLHSDAEFEGSGIGLALVRRYLDLNGATITADSVKGRGSCFRIEIPESAATSR